VIGQLAQAGQAISASAQWLKVESPAQMVSPYAELAELAQATVSALRSRCARAVAGSQPPCVVRQEHGTGVSPLAWDRAGAVWRWLWADDCPVSGKSALSH